MAEKEKVYPRGIMCFAKHANAPEFILGSVVITLADFREWINGEGKQYLTKYNEKDQIRFTVMQSDKNGLNFQVDTFVPTKQQNKILPNEKTAQTAKTKTDDSVPF